VSDDVYEELKRLVRELGVESPNQVIRKLIEHYRWGTPHHGSRGTPHNHPLDQIVNCRAVQFGGAYLVTCSDGRKAWVPEESLQKLAARLGDAIEIVSNQTTHKEKQKKTHHEEGRSGVTLRYVEVLT